MKIAKDGIAFCDAWPWPDVKPGDKFVKLYNAHSERGRQYLDEFVRVTYRITGRTKLTVDYEIVDAILIDMTSMFARMSGKTEKFERKPVEQYAEHDSDRHWKVGKKFHSHLNRSPFNYGLAKDMGQAFEEMAKFTFGMTRGILWDRCDDEDPVRVLWMEAQRNIMPVLGTGRIKSGPARDLASILMDYAAAKDDWEERKRKRRENKEKSIENNGDDE